MKKILILLLTLSSTAVAADENISIVNNLPSNSVLYLQCPAEGGGNVLLPPGGRVVLSTAYIEKIGDYYPTDNYQIGCHLVEHDGATKIDGADLTVMISTIHNPPLVMAGGMEVDSSSNAYIIEGNYADTAYVIPSPFKK